MREIFKLYFILCVAFLSLNECRCKRGGGSIGRSLGSIGRSSNRGSSGGGNWFSGLFGGSKTSSASKMNTHSSHAGAPPPYPGLQNRPVYYGNNPPPYSSLNHNPNKYYGRSFGGNGLQQNTYLYNNYYGSRSYGSSGLLTYAMFFHMGHSMGHRNHYRRDWDEEEDRRWRGTTQGPYFENKVPGEDKILPASAVVGAATAFGLVSLLPLNVPPSKPLMYCNNTDLAQSPIRINNGYFYYCFNNTIEILCPPEMSKTCEKRTMLCDTDEDIYCHNATLLSKNFIFCNSTTLFNETTTILNCYEGEIPSNEASFIPTTTAYPTTTEISFAAQTHIFFLKLLGQYDLDQITTSSTQTPEETTNIEHHQWIPEALTIPPEMFITEPTKDLNIEGEMMIESTSKSTKNIIVNASELIDLAIIG